MNLNTDTWKEFLLADLFNIAAGIYHYPDEYEDGNTPYISASNENNGVSQKINLKPDFKGNCIITGKLGCTAFYQPNDFCATSDVNIFIPKNFSLNEKIGLFIVSVINSSENYKWNYGRQCRISDSESIIIKLPVCVDNNKRIIKDPSCKYSPNGYIPDWEYMENYIKSLHSKPIVTQNKLKNTNTTPLLVQNWNEFKFSDIFDCSIAKSVDFGNTEEGTILFVGREGDNNGFQGYVNVDNSKITKGNCITLSMVGSYKHAFYQPKDFVASQNILIIRNEKLNQKNGLFLCTLINMDMLNKYSYGRSIQKNHMCNYWIKLPVDNNGNPDWEYMENYIKSLPYGDRI